MKAVDCIIRNARVAGTGNVRDIEITDGIISSITESSQAGAKDIIDAEKRLVCPPFVDPHLHLDAALTVGNPDFNRSGTLQEGIRLWGEYKKNLSIEDIKSRAYRAITWMVSQGTTFVRSHVDVSEPALTGVKALTELKSELKGIVDIQLVAFPQDGIFTFPEGKALLEKSLAMGIDVVGGIPHNELTREDGIKDVELVFALAEERDLLIDIHCDETDDDQSRFLETVAALTIKKGMEGRVTASHTTAMHSYNNAYTIKLIGNLARAGMHIIVNPFDNSILQARGDSYPKRRGITRVDELLAGGVNIAVGHDSILDPWYPLGRGNMLHALNLLIHIAQLAGYDELVSAIDLITGRAALLLNIQDRYGIEEGKPADLIILDAADEFEAVRLMPECLYVMRSGKVIARTEPSYSTVELSRGREVVDLNFHS